MHHSVSLRGGHSNHSVSSAGKVLRVRPARCYCRPMVHFIFMYKSTLHIYIYLYINTHWSMVAIIFTHLYLFTVAWWHYIIYYLNYSFTLKHVIDIQCSIFKEVIKLVCVEFELPTYWWTYWINSPCYSSPGWHNQTFYRILQPWICRSLRHYDIALGFQEVMDICFTNFGCYIYYHTDIFG